MQDEGDDIIALLFSVGLVSPTAFPFRIAKSRQSSRSMLAALVSRCPNPCLGRSDAPRCSFRSKCQVKALLHGRNERRKDNENLHDMQGEWTK